MEERNIQILKLFPNVIPVKGYNRSLLIDLLNGKPYLVPNDFIDYINELPNSENEEYEKFIIENELGIWIDLEIGECLTPLPLNHYPVSKINNSILELDENSSWDLESVLSRLNDLGTQFLEVRFLDYNSFQKHFITLQRGLEGSTIETIQIYIPYNNQLQDFLNSSLNKSFFRLGKIVVYNANQGFELNNKFYDIVFSSQESISHENCGNISPEYFCINVHSYVNNRNFNSCLSHKISVDKDGYICNCPSLNSRYENVDSVTFSEIIDNPNFQKKWHLTKDEILVCSVCEFRWICNDCRAFTIHGAENGKPSKCEYNPFISLWKNDENYLTEQECGIRFEENKMFVNHLLIEEINQKIWG